jgi:hypothetical protein
MVAIEFRALAVLVGCCCALRLAARLVPLLMPYVRRVLRGLLRSIADANSNAGAAVRFWHSMYATHWNLFLVVLFYAFSSIARRTWFPGLIAGKGNRPHIQANACCVFLQCNCILRFGSLGGLNLVLPVMRGYSCCAVLANILHSSILQ